MDIKIALLVMLAASFLLFGCAGKARQDSTEQPPEISAPADGQPPAEQIEQPSEGGQPAEEPEQSDVPPEESAENASTDDSALADLFQVDTDKPISDEGFDVSTPSSD